VELPALPASQALHARCRDDLDCLHVGQRWCWQNIPPCKASFAHTPCVELYLHTVPPSTAPAYGERKLVDSPKRTRTGGQRFAGSPGLVDDSGARALPHVGRGRRHSHGAKLQACGTWAQLGRGTSARSAPATKPEPLNMQRQNQNLSTCSDKIRTSQHESRGATNTKRSLAAIRNHRVFLEWMQAHLEWMQAHPTKPA
jgi:hypothetical protein